MTVQKVGDQDLKLFQDEITTQFEGIKSEVKRLQGTIDGLEGRWKGVGAGAFDLKQNEINMAMVRISRLLLNFQEAIQVTRTTAGNTEDEVQAALRGVDVTGGFSGDAAAEKQAVSNIAKY
ncbi:WXG100 family type VII secretion target [Streptomyces sp. F63]|uniref:WXG100 family type VII secretion target n=1 Tax=Streptomyces sp. F63 TaxID=2824887 RepID=UPI001B35907E|nr:WXG100 family type VII secretion target [Streptomyces sp. F63]MBQ0984371.1 WXG100 family type VII secretion target [Streptomyces sp. F63]